MCRLVLIRATHFPTTQTHFYFLALFSIAFSWRLPIYQRAFARGSLSALYFVVTDSVSQRTYSQLEILGDVALAATKQLLR